MWGAGNIFSFCRFACFRRSRWIKLVSVDPDVRVNCPWPNPTSPTPWIRNSTNPVDRSYLAALKMLSCKNLENSKRLGQIVILALCQYLRNFHISKWRNRTHIFLLSWVNTDLTKGRYVYFTLSTLRLPFEIHNKWTSHGMDIFSRPNCSSSDLVTTQAGRST